MTHATRMIGTIATRAVVLCLLVPAACTTKERAPEESSLSAVQMTSSPELATAVASYRGARYQESFDQSKNLARAAASPLREQAAWIAGLSAYQLDRFDEAELQFMSSSRSEDQRLVVDSKIMMGDVRVNQNRWSDAAQYYRDAANGLSGEERSRVLGYAELASAHAASRATGQRGSTVSTTPAGGRSSTGSSPSTSPRSTPSASPVGSSTGGSAFALQAGAFQNETNARRRATEIAASARQAGLGEPRVVRTRDTSGREYWAVQVGSFATRQGAEQARTRAQGINFIVATAS